MISVMKIKALLMKSLPQLRGWPKQFTCLCEVTESLAMVHRLIPPGSAETMWGWGAGRVKGRAKEHRGPCVEPNAGLEHRHWPWPWMPGGTVLSLFIWLPSSSWKTWGKVRRWLRAEGGKALQTRRKMTGVIGVPEILATAKPVSLQFFAWSLKGGITSDVF